MILKKLYAVFIFVFTIFLLYLMFFGFGRTPMLCNVVRLIPLNSTFDFFLNSIGTKIFIINIFGNILMFVPYGFLGLIFPKCRNFKLLIFDFLTAIVLVEALQYFTRLGVFDIDDVLLNTFGVGIGFWVFTNFCKSEKKNYP